MKNIVLTTIEQRNKVTDLLPNDLDAFTVTHRREKLPGNLPFAVDTRLLAHKYISKPAFF